MSEINMIEMPKKLGKIDKPSIEEYKTGRKLYCIPLLYSAKDAPKDYVKLYNQYWTQVKEHVEKLERAGKANKIYHESIYSTGQDGLEKIKQENVKSYRIVKSKVDEGAALISLEDNRLLSEYIDWAMCLSIIRSTKVAEKIQKFYLEAEKRRDEYIVKRIDETLKKGEVGILVMRDENRIRIQSKLQSDIHVFLVHPPALNDLSQWIKERIREKFKK